MNQYALGYKLLKNVWKVKPDTIRTAFLFGLEHELQILRLGNSCVDG